MKLNKKLAAIIAGSAIVTTTAFTMVSEPLAKPRQVDGLYVFVMSEPSGEYYKLGQVGSGTNTALTKMLQTVIKNAKTQYPDATGVIFDETKNIGYAIQFKKK